MNRSSSKSSISNLSRVNELCQILKNMCGNTQDINEVIDIGEAYGQLCCENSCGVYREDFFEERLLELTSNIKLKTIPKDRILHVITIPIKTGGHTRLMERLVHFAPDCSDILVTGPYEMNSESLRVPESSIVHYSRNGIDYFNIINIAAEYDKIFLHINPGDLKAAAAVSVVKRDFNCKVIFINHADHIFSFGFKCTDIVAEVSLFGLAISKSFRNCNSSYLGIPLDIEEYPIISFQKKGGYNIISAGNYRKYKPSEDISFQKIADRLLNEIKNVHITIIGPRVIDYWWWCVKIKHFNRLNIKRSVPYKDYISSLRDADIYIDSSPISGGTALPEARSLGILVTGLLTGANGYTPFDGVKLSTDTELIDNIKQIIINGGGGLIETNNDAMIINASIKCHSLSQVKERFLSIINGGSSEIFYGLNYEPDLEFFKKQWLIKNKIVMPYKLINLLLRSNKMGLSVYGKIGLINYLKFQVRGVIKGFIRFARSRIDK